MLPEFYETERTNIFNPYQHQLEVNKEFHLRIALRFRTCSSSKTYSMTYDDQLQ